jgi:hypothetical protein
LPLVDKWSYFGCCLHTPCSPGGPDLLSLNAL